MRLFLYILMLLNKYSLHSSGMIPLKGRQFIKSLYGITVFTVILGVFTSSLHDFAHSLESIHSSCNHAHHHSEQESEKNHSDSHQVCYFCSIAVTANLSCEKKPECNFGVVSLHFCLPSELHGLSLFDDFFLRAPPVSIA